MSFSDRYNDSLCKSMVHPMDPNMAIFCVFAYSIEYILWPQLSINPGTLDTSVYYNIEVINYTNIKRIFVDTTRMQSPTHNTAGILVSNRDLDSHFCSGCAEQAQN